MMFSPTNEDKIMKDILGILNDLRRPRLLLRAARLGADEYSRNQHLKRHLGYGALPRSGPALMRLLELESDINDKRRKLFTGQTC